MICVLMDLFEKCLAGKHRSKFTITASAVGRYCVSPFLVWCDAFAPVEEREPQSAYQHLLFERGIEHEKNVMKSLFKGAFSVPIVSFEEGFKEVLEACKKEVRVLTQAPLFFLDDEIHGVADVIVRSNSHSSIFGDFHYVVKEIKSAKNLRREHIMQAAFYNLLIGKIQGFVPAKFFVINREMEEFEFSFEDYSEELNLILDDIRAIYRGKKVSPTAKSCKSPWEAYCNKMAVESNDVSIVSSVGSALKKKLNDVGIFTVKQLASQPIDLDIPEATLRRIKSCAQAWVDKKPVILSKPKVRKSDVELFFDFEGTDELQTEEGLVKVDYLIGLLVRDSESIKFKPFVSENLAGEEAMFRSFVSYLKKYSGAPVYHYGSYERTHLIALGQKYKVDVKFIVENLVDVLSLVRKNVMFPTLSMSLKDISKFLGFKYRGMADAQDSIVLYLKFLATKEQELLQRIIDYNEDDVRATMVIKDFLSSL